MSEEITQITKNQLKDALFFLRFASEMYEYHNYPDIRICCDELRTEFMKKLIAMGNLSNYTIEGILNDVDNIAKHLESAKKKQAGGKEEQMIECQSCDCKENEHELLLMRKCRSSKCVDPLTNASRCKGLEWRKKAE